MHPTQGFEIMDVRGGLTRQRRAQDRPHPAGRVAVLFAYAGIGWIALAGAVFMAMELL